VGSVRLVSGGLGGDSWQRSRQQQHPS